MPLIIDPESCCDVCLEPLTYDDPKPPHAIPCGHIFCRECLITMHPKICPLCRKSYQTERVKKLITGEGEEPAQREGRKLLLKLVMLWDEDPRGELSTVTGEVQRWIDAGNKYEPLEKGNRIITHYHILGMDNTEAHRAIRRLRRELQQRELEQINERDTALANNNILNNQMQELEEKIAIYEGQIASLRQEIDSFKLSKNPLPAPPEPYPLEQLPLFAQRNGGGSSRYQWPNPPTNGNAGPPYRNTNGYNNPSESTEPYSSVSPYVPPPPPLDDRNSRGKPPFRRPQYEIYGPPGPAFLAPVSSPIAEVNGLKNAIIPGASPGKRFMPKSVFEDAPGQAHPMPPELQPRLLGLETSGDDVLPPPPPMIDPYRVMEDYVTEYANGYQEGYQVAHRTQPQRHARSSRREGAPTRAAARSPLREPPSPPRPQTAAASQAEIPRWYGEMGITLPARSTTSVQQTVPPHSAPAQQSATTTNGAPTYRQDDGRRGTSRQHPPPASEPPSSTSVNGAGPRSAYARHNPHTPASTPIPSQTYVNPSAFPVREANEEQTQSSRPRSERRRTIQPDGSLTENEATRRVSETSTIYPTALHRRFAVAARRSSSEAPTQPSAPPSERTSMVSSSGSWGTVNTDNPAPLEDQPIRDSAHFYNGSIGSVRDLQLRSFDDFSEPPSRASLVSVDRGSLGSIHEGMNMAFLPANPPMQGNGQQQQQYQSQQQSSDTERERERGDLTPRIRPISLADSQSSFRSPSANSQATERPPRDRRQASYPVIPTAASGSTYHGHNPDHLATTTTNNANATQEPPASAPSRSSRAHRRASSQVNQWANTGYMLEPPAGGNALGLEDIVAVSPEMAAPTPVVSSRNFLRSFSYD